MRCLCIGNYDSIQHTHTHTEAQHTTAQHINVPLTSQAYIRPLYYDSQLEDYLSGLTPVWKGTMCSYCAANHHFQPHLHFQLFLFGASVR